MARLWVLLWYSYILYVFSGLASDRSPRQRKSWRHAVVVTNKLIILETRDRDCKRNAYVYKNKRLHVLKLTMGWEWPDPADGNDVDLGRQSRKGTYPTFHLVPKLSYAPSLFWLEDFTNSRCPWSAFGWVSTRPAKQIITTSMSLKTAQQQRKDENLLLLSMQRPWNRIFSLVPWSIWHIPNRQSQASESPLLKIHS